MAWVYKGGDIGLVWEDDGTAYSGGLSGGPDNFISPVAAPAVPGISTGGMNSQPAAPLPTVSTIGNAAPWQPSPWEYTPEQLGWTADEAQRFKNAGIDKLPAYMQKASLYGAGTNLSGDPVDEFINIYTNPVGNSGRADRARSTLSGELGNIDLNSEEGKKAYTEILLGDKWKTNEGAWKSSILPAIQGIGSILAPIAGLGAAGAFAAPVAAGAAEAGAAGGAGLSAADAGAMLGESAAGYGAAGAGGGAPSVFAGGLSAPGFSETGNLGQIGGNVAGYSNAAEGIGQSSISTTDLLTNNLPGAAATTGGLGDAGLSPLTGAATGAALGGGVGSIWDSITNLLGPSGGNGTGGGTDWGSILGPLLGVGGAVAGGYFGNEAIQDSIDKMQKYNEPFYDLGVSNIAGLNAADPTGGSGQFMDALKNYGTNFKFDTTNPAYTQQLAETTRLNDQNLAARGMYNSRAGLNLQDQSARNLTATEYDKQYSRGYGNLTDLFNMSRQTGATNYAKLLDMVKIGSGAASSAGQGSLASGQSEANLYSGLGAMPMNYMILQQMLSGGK